MKRINTLQLSLIIPLFALVGISFITRNLEIGKYSWLLTSAILGIQSSSYFGKKERKEGTIYLVL